MTLHDSISSIDSASNDQAKSDSHARIVASVQRGESSGYEELYETTVRCVRGYYLSQLGSQDFGDHAHDVYLNVLDSVKRGLISDPQRLAGYIKTIAFRGRAEVIKQLITARHHEVENTDFGMHGVLCSAEQTVAEKNIYDQQKKDISIRLLCTMPLRERDILTRFYLQGQRPEQIMAELDLTATQFRLAKSRAKQALKDRVQTLLARSSDSNTRFRTIDPPRRAFPSKR